MPAGATPVWTLSNHDVPRFPTRWARERPAPGAAPRSCCSWAARQHVPLRRRRARDARHRRARRPARRPGQRPLLPGVRPRRRPHTDAVDERGRAPGSRTRASSRGSRSATSRSTSRTSAGIRRRSSRSPAISSGCATHCPTCALARTRRSTRPTACSRTARRANRRRAEPRPVDRGGEPRHRGRARRHRSGARRRTGRRRARAGARRGRGRPPRRPPRLTPTKRSRHVQPLQARSSVPRTRGRGQAVARSWVAVHARRSSTGHEFTIRSGAMSGLGGPGAPVGLPAELARRVRVGVDGDLAAHLVAIASSRRWRVEPLGAAVDLDGLVELGAHAANTSSASNWLAARPSADDQAAGAVPEDVHVRARDRRRPSAPSSRRRPSSAWSGRSRRRRRARRAARRSWSSVPSSRMSTSMPRRIRSGASSSFNASTRSSCSRSRSGVRPCATVRRGEWSVIARYSWPSSAAVRAIALDR